MKKGLNKSSREGKKGGKKQMLVFLLKIKLFNRSAMGGGGKEHGLEHPGVAS